MTYISWLLAGKFPQSYKKSQKNFTIFILSHSFCLFAILTLQSNHKPIVFLTNFFNLKNPMETEITNQTESTECPPASPTKAPLGLFEMLKYGNTHHADQATPSSDRPDDATKNVLSRKRHSVWDI